MKRSPPPAPSSAGKPAEGSARARPGFPAKLNTAPARAPVGSVSGASVRTTAAAPRLAVSTGVGMDSSAVRHAMVRKLQAQGITHEGVLDALRTVERHRFVDSALAPQAYEDTSLPIGLGQTISKPSVVARMLELLCQGREGRIGRVLDIGTGCGYQATVLSHLVQEVYSIERLKALHEKARENLRPFRLANVHLLFGDGMLGYAQGAPYAGIVAAAGGNDVPQAWIEQLAPGGRLVAPAVTGEGQQHLVVIECHAHGYTRSVLEPVMFVPLKSGVS